MKQTYLMLKPVTCGPSANEAAGQAEQGDDADQGKAATGLLGGLLGKGFLVFWRVRGGDGRAINAQGTAATPEVLARNGGFGLGDEAFMDFL